jgi:hypothetical protein
MGPAGDLGIGDYVTGEKIVIWSFKVYDISEGIQYTFHLHGHKAT